MTKRFLAALLVAALLVAFSNCSKKSNSCPYTTVDMNAPDSEVTKVQTYLATHAIDATEAPEGFFYAIDNVGTGATPGLCSNVTVKYTGTFTDGTVFDSTGANTASFSLGQLIVAWQQGLPYIRSGGKIRLYVPPSLGYGAAGVKDNSGKVLIPPNAILIFDIDLVTVY